MANLPVQTTRTEKVYDDDDLKAEPLTLLKEERKSSRIHSKSRLPTLI